MSQDHVYFKVRRVDDKGRSSAHLSEHDAISIRDIFNGRYESEYEVVKDTNPSDLEIRSAQLIESFEL